MSCPFHFLEQSVMNNTVMRNRRQPFISDSSFLLNNNPNWKNKIAMCRCNERAVQQNIVSCRSNDYHRSVSQPTGPWRSTHPQNSVLWTHAGLRSHNRYAHAWVVFIYLCVHWNGFFRTNNLIAYWVYAVIKMTFWYNFLFCIVGILRRGK